MTITETNLKGCYILEPKIFEDNRGLFFESYNKRDLDKQLGKSINFVQDNHSISTKGVLRGLHYQQGEFAQTKLVRVTSGEVLDVVVDLRKDSSTFGDHFKTKLTAKNKKMIFLKNSTTKGGSWRE